MNATPSKMLNDWCINCHMSRRKTAASLGCSPAAVQFIINGTMRVGADMAIKLEHVTHIPAVDWLVAQAKRNRRNGAPVYLSPAARERPCVECEKPTLWRSTAGDHPWCRRCGKGAANGGTA